ncbi:MAG: HesA/MoeB/ThiF family protein [Deltaproteobacteria bacterium]|nr:HesA/MoeB/ThiF family protein [Deltaproteobacteria bacterium]
METAARELSARIEKGARWVEDSAGRRVRILEDRHAMGIAEECGCSPGDVYRQALSMKICPYRYIRNEDSLSIDEQWQLASSRVTVVGAGGLGGQVILLLARLGIGFLNVVDQDVFDETNLNRQALSDMGAIGEGKASKAALAVASFNPGTEVTTHRVRLRSENAAKILMKSHVVVDALDTIRDRFVLEDAARALGIPLVHGALAGFEGRVMTIFPGDPGLRDLYGGPGGEDPDPRSPEALMGVPPLAPALIGTLQAMEVVKILLGRGEVFRNTMVHVALETGEWRRFSFAPSRAED